MSTVSDAGRLFLTFNRCLKPSSSRLLSTDTIAADSRPRSLFVRDIARSQVSPVLAEDPWIIGRREVSRVSNGSVRWIRLTDVDAARQFRESAEDLVDFVFSDSLNTFEGMRATWEAWSPLVAPNGIYIIANSHSTPARQIETAGSVRFTRDVIRRDPRFEWRETVGSFTVLRRRDYP